MLLEKRLSIRQSLLLFHFMQDLERALKYVGVFSQQRPEAEFSKVSAVSFWPIGVD